MRFSVDTSGRMAFFIRQFTSLRTLLILVFYTSSQGTGTQASTQGPGKPRNVTVEATSSVSILVSWKEPFLPNGNQSEYWIYFGQQKEDLNQTTVAGSERRWELSALRPFTTYYIKVRAKTTELGNASALLNVTTLEDSPGKPRNVTVEATSSTSINVSWKEPFLLNGVIREYRIYFGQQKDDLNQTTVAGSERRWELIALRPFTTYYIKVRAKTTELGNASALLNATTFEDRPSAPTQFSGSVFGRHASVSWNEPVNKNGIVRKYIIEVYLTKTGEVARRLELDATKKRQAMITELTPFTNYTFTIRAFTKAGEWANFTAITKEEVPDGEKACSCYTFENREKGRFSWPQARDSCESNNKSLVIMETTEEWEFINASFKDQIGNKDNEWHIGLLKNPTTGTWSWINGKPLTFDKWQKGKPEQQTFYVLIAKEFPPGFFGSFNSINRNVHRGWICEEQTDECQGICMHHYPASATTTATLITNNIQNSETPSTIQNSETLVITKEKPDSTTSSTASNVRRTTVYQKRNTNPMTVTIIIIAAVLGAMLFVLLLLLVVVVLRKRKKRLGKDPENSPASSTKLPEHQYESVPAVEATKLIGLPQNGKESPQVECEYAVVNKLKKKPRKGELVYAELADFGDTNNDKEKPEHQETTVYADVVTSDVYHKEDSDASDPAYANVQSVK